ncbi:MAG TPA: DUF2283 domain-containing protein [Planctomycetota bacterium]|nr:DUF2283 domain-containing protein [Planctomycetota bacterium]
MKPLYLEVTYRSGRAVAAYLRLPGRPVERPTRSEHFGDGLIVDFTAGGRAVGVEITAPTLFDVDKLNQVLNRVGRAPVSKADVAPISAV